LITVSIISHGQIQLCKTIINQLVKIKLIEKIILTLNIDEKINFKLNKKIILIRNKKPRGFGENHNKAFKLCRTQFFCVLNPDIKLIKNPFKILIKQINKETALVAPQIVNKNLVNEDNARVFPSPLSILMKLFFNYTGTYEINKNSENIYPDWIAGMFMIFSSNIFKKIRGFDEKFYLYYEDVDICCRLKKLKKNILVNTKIKVIHDARRASRKNIYFFRFHIMSIFLYFFKNFGRLP